MAHVLYLLCLLACCALSSAQQELFQNPDFEDPFGEDNWWCIQCQLDHSTDAYTGQYSGQVTNRDETWGGVTQNVNLEPNKNYFFTLRLKVIQETPGLLWDSLKAMVAIEYAGDTEYLFVSENPHVREAYGWQLFAGDFALDGREIQSARFYLEFETVDVDYLVDTASLTEVVHNPDWVQEANARIEQIRMEDLTVVLSMSSDYDPGRMEVQVSQTKHDFPFGSTVTAALITGQDSTSQQYQEFFYDNFGYAVLENDLKWQQMEPNRGEVDFDTPDGAIDAMLSRGVPVRGHCNFWNLEQWVPDWMLPLEGDEFLGEVDRRLDYTMNHFRDRLIHWDVNNEQLKGEFYEAKTGDPYFLEYMFHTAYDHNSDILLFLNDYDIVNTGIHVAAYTNQAEMLADKGVPVYGVGAQSHMFWGVPDTDLVFRRLDMLASAGLPIWITELDVVEPDVSQRANGYEWTLRAYFSHPAVEGVLLWGFWDGSHWLEDASLVDGPNFDINEAGLRYQSLVHDEWVTRFTWQPEQQEDTYETRAFQGGYSLNVLYDDVIIQEQDFYVSKGQSQTVYVDIGL